LVGFAACAVIWFRGAFRVLMGCGSCSVVVPGLDRSGG
jgi:hypothetical protein